MTNETVTVHERYAEDRQRLRQQLDAANATAARVSRERLPIQDKRERALPEFAREAREKEWRRSSLRADLNMTRNETIPRLDGELLGLAARDSGARELLRLANASRRAARIAAATERHDRTKQAMEAKQAELEEAHRKADAIERETLPKAEAAAEKARTLYDRAAASINADFERLSDELHAAEREAQRLRGELTHLEARHDEYNRQEGNVMRVNAVRREFAEPSEEAPGA
ncbi:MAG: hypothetical protein F4Y00_00775 [Bacteroidetes bacterium SB0662_bin_6]|nr:hypothetical protein [Bacteroidetes bacterium SB0668_bin_1]MYE03500.1 hypothetical protein [Bacteroidetes bacterium SB0662_bin_6]